MNIVKRSYQYKPYQEIRCCDCGTVLSLDWFDFVMIERDGFHNIVCPVCGKLVIDASEALRVMEKGTPGNPFYDWYQAGKRWWFEDLTDKQKDWLLHDFDESYMGQDTIFEKLNELAGLY